MGLTTEAKGWAVFANDIYFTAPHSLVAAAAGLSCAFNPRSLWWRCDAVPGPHSVHIPKASLQKITPASQTPAPKFITHLIPLDFMARVNLFSSVAVQPLLPRSRNNTFSKILGSIPLGRTPQTWVLEHYQFLQLSAVSWALLSNMQSKPLPCAASHDSGSHLWLEHLY